MATTSTPTPEQVAAVRRILKCANYYEVLDISVTATRHEITKSYRSWELLVHPDKNPDKDAETAAKIVNIANTILSDVERRFLYEAEYRKLSHPLDHDPFFDGRRLNPNAYRPGQGPGPDLANNEYVNAGPRQRRPRRQNKNPDAADLQSRQNFCNTTRIFIAVILLAIVISCLKYLSEQWPEIEIQRKLQEHEMERQLKSEEDREKARERKIQREIAKFEGKQLYSLQRTASYSAQRHTAPPVSAPFYSIPMTLVDSETSARTLFEAKYPYGTPSRAEAEARIENEYIALVANLCTVEKDNNASS